MNNKFSNKIITAINHLHKEKATISILMFEGQVFEVEIKPKRDQFLIKALLLEWNKEISKAPRSKILSGLFQFPCEIQHLSQLKVIIETILPNWQPTLYFMVDLTCNIFIKEMQKDPDEGEKPRQVETIQQKLAKVNVTDPSLPTQIQKKHVYQVYDKIACHFSHTRYKAWPKIEQFLNQLEPGSTVYDVGCGNGKYLGVNPSLYMLGTDRSVGLLKTAQQKNQNYQLFSADSLYLPLRSQTCDAFISIAVIHHFSSDGQRLRAIRELVRVLRVGGEGLISVWAFEQEMQGQESASKRRFKEQDVFVPWHLSFKYQADLQKIDHQGCEIDYVKKTVIYKRYYHVFRKGELQELVAQVEQVKVVLAYYDKQNWCCRIRKIK